MSNKMAEDEVLFAHVRDNPSRRLNNHHKARHA